MEVQKTSFSFEEGVSKRKVSKQHEDILMLVIVKKCELRGHYY